MKEAFEKIKERLEEKKDNLVNNHKLFTDMGKGRLVLVCEAEIEAFTNAISIVSEVEAEYGNVKTNADRIRSMTDEELACFLATISARGGWTDWLKSESEVEHEKIC